MYRARFILNLDDAPNFSTHNKVQPDPCMQRHEFVA